jgi:hypothetical protein
MQENVRQLPTKESGSRIQEAKEMKKCIFPFQLRVLNRKCSKGVLVNGLWNRRRPAPNDPDQNTTVTRIPKRPHS